MNYTNGLKGIVQSGNIELFQLFLGRYRVAPDFSDLYARSWSSGNTDFVNAVGKVYVESNTTGASLISKWKDFLAYSAKFNRIKFITCLYPRYQVLSFDIKPAVTKALRYGHFDAFRLLYENFAQTVIPGMSLGHMLNEAVKSGNIDLSQYLLDRGAIPTLDTLIAARQYGNFALAEALSHIVHHS